MSCQLAFTTRTISVFALVVLGTAVGDNRILQSSDLSKELFHFVLKKNNILLELDGGVLSCKRGQTLVENVNFFFFCDEKILIR
jgi:hypothetical protein